MMRFFHVGPFNPIRRCGKRRRIGYAWLLSGFDPLTSPPTYHPSM